MDADRLAELAAVLEGADGLETDEGRAAVAHAVSVLRAEAQTLRDEAAVRLMHFSLQRVAATPVVRGASPEVRARLDRATEAVLGA